jgi:hypothetical protein
MKITFAMGKTIGLATKPYVQAILEKTALFCEAST